MFFVFLIFVIIVSICSYVCLNVFICCLMFSFDFHLIIIFCFVFVDMFSLCL